MLTSFTNEFPVLHGTGEWGATARDLHWLAVNGFPIPATWVLSAAAFELILSRTGADQTVAEMRWNLTGLWEDLEAAERVMQALEEHRVSVARALRSAQLPDPLGRKLEEVVLMETVWMVRTSPVFEEQVIQIPEFSLAGVGNGQALWDGVRQVWASAYRREVLEHCAQNDVPLPRMAVVLHPIKPVSVQDRSGTAYSVAPWSGIDGPGVQAVFGALQNGKGHAYGRACGQWISMRDHLPVPRRAIVIPRSGGTRLAPYPAGKPLNSDEAARLAGLAEDVAAVEGRPVALDFIWPTGSEPVLLRKRELAV
jgi:hypothetical protein